MMMTCKLIFGNLKRNFKDYAIYFLAMILAVSIFYAFNAATKPENLKSLGTDMLVIMNAVNSTIKVISQIIAVLLGFLIIYVNNFLLKKRKKELGTYMLLGMKKSKISVIFMGETLVVGVVSFLIGIVAGVFLGQIINIATLKLFGGNVDSFFIHFSLESCWFTLVCFAIIYVITMIYNFLSVHMVKLIDLITAERKNESFKKRNNIVYVISFIIGIMCIYLTVIHLESNEMMPTVQALEKAIIFAIIGTLCIFYSFAAISLMLAKKCKKFYYKDINSFIVRQIGSRIQGNFVSVSFSTILLTITILLITTGSSIALSVKDMSKQYTPYDFVLIYETDKPAEMKERVLEYQPENELYDLIENEFQISGYNSDITYGEIWEGQKVELWETDKGLEECNISMVSISDYNKALRMQGKEEIALAEDEFMINCNYKGTMQYMDYMIKNTSKLTICGVELKSASNELLENTYMMTSIGNNDRGTLIVPDGIAQRAVMTEIVLQGFLKKDVAPEKLNKQLDNLVDYENLEGALFGWNSKDRMNTMYYVVLGFPIFICTYVGILFLMIAVAMLSVQQLTQISDNKYRFSVLEKQGVSDKMTRQAILKQVGVYFMAPLVLAGIYTLIAQPMITAKVSDMFNLEIGTHAIVTLLFIIILYGGYYLTTYSSCVKMIFTKH